MTSRRFRPGLTPPTGPKTGREPVWVHDGGCGGPVYFELAGGFCYRCGAGPLNHAGMGQGFTVPGSRGGRYVHQNDYRGPGWPVNG